MALVQSPSKESDSFQLGFSALPQYGFGPDLTFDSLVEHNPFLFRVYTPKPMTPFFDSSEPFFIGQKFKNKYRYSVQDFQAMSPTSGTPDEPGIAGSYADVANHMDGAKKASSPYVTTSFSFAWAIWEASRRYRANPAHEVEIAVIDARAVAGRAVTALELLRKGSPKERHPDHWKWYRFATEAQDVLVFGYVPGSAVLASVPILSLLPKLPSYFLHPDPQDAGPALWGGLTWDAAARAGYQQFCQQMSEQFLRAPADVRLRDTTAGAVRLALGFLRPWFQRAARKDFAGACGALSELAYIVARWPGQWWVREHTEIWDLVQGMVQVVGEEVRDAQRVHALGEVTRLQGVVSELQLLTDEVVSVHAHSRPGSVSEHVERPLTPPASDSGKTDADADKSEARAGRHEADARRTDTVRVDTEQLQMPATMTVTKTTVTASVQAGAPPAPSTVETASCVLTSFLFGAFAALFLINSQRRELALYVT